MTTDVGKDIDKKELCAAGWNANSPVTRQVTIEYLKKKLKIDLSYDPGISLLDIYPQRQYITEICEHE